MKKGKFFVVAVAVAVGTILILGIFLNNSRKAPTNVANDQNEAQTVAGQIASVSSGELFIEDQTSGERRPIRGGDGLRIGDTIIAGRGVHATLKFVRPEGVSEDADLVFVKPLPGEKYSVTVTIQRNEDGSVEAMINS